MKCLNCGKNLEKGNKFCALCGAVVPVKKKTNIIPLAIAGVLIIGIATASVVLVSNFRKSKNNETTSIQSASFGELTEETDTVIADSSSSVFEDIEIYTATTEYSTVAPEPAIITGLLTPTDKDWNNLTDQLYTLLLQEYDCTTATTEDVAFKIADTDLYFLVTKIYDYDGCLYFFDGKITDDKGNEYEYDPRMGDYWWYRFPKMYVNTIFKDVFNIQPQNIDELHSPYTDDICWFEKGDDYYVYHEVWGIEEVIDIVIDSKVALGDGRYKVKLAYSDWHEGDDPAPCKYTIYVTVGLKNINGRRFWSIYKIEK